MGQAIGGSLALAIGIALSPVPIIAVVLMLTTRQARVNGPAFVIGWLAGLAVVGAIILCIAGPSDASEDGAPATWVSWLKIVLGAALLLVAARQFRGRPKDTDRAALPKWMASIDTIKPPAAFGLAAVLAGANPKNLLLEVTPMVAAPRPRVEVDRGSTGSVSPDSGTAGTSGRRARARLAALAAGRRTGPGWLARMRPWMPAQPAGSCAGSDTVAG
jgi:threonine/homoserine/homoserine lactone efflux protein